MSSSPSGRRAASPRTMPWFSERSPSWSPASRWISATIDGCRCSGCSRRRVRATFRRIRNCLTALQRQAGVSGTALRMRYGGEIGLFVAHALRETSEVAEQVTDVLFAYLDAGALEHILTARTSEVLRELLSGLPDAVPRQR